MDAELNTAQGATLPLYDRGRREYAGECAAMRRYTRARGGAGEDQLWLLEHFPVYTLGRRAAPAPAVAAAIPVVRTDRGGQATYHGPGQAVLYTLLDLKRRGLGVRRYVRLLEETVIAFLDDCGVRARRLPGAPGVYVEGRKIASLGLSVFNGCCYHGVALNVCMDLSPFGDIVACGLRGVEATQMADCGVTMDVGSAGAGLARSLAARL